jgi:hypothetical protein
MATTIVTAICRSISFATSFCSARSGEPPDIDPAKGALEDLKRVVSQIRKRWPKVHILVRGDSGFCRDAIMTWCERQGIDYVFGLAKNPRLDRDAVSRNTTIDRFSSIRKVRMFAP